MVVSKNVLVVGGGPIGSFLALVLKRYGVQVKIIDKITEPTTFTKALTINSSTLKTFQGVGIVDDFLRQGKIITDAEFYYNGRFSARLNKKYLDSVHNYFLSIPQTLTESILHQKLNEHGVEVNYSQELIALLQHEDYVTATIRNLKTGNVEEEQFSFVVGCDGAHSATRKLAGLSFEGHDYDMYFVVADVFFEDSCKVEKSTYFADETGGFVGTFLMRDDGCTRLAIKENGFLSRDKPPAFTKEYMQEYLDKHLVNKPLKIKELVWSSGAQIISRLTEAGSVGRVFIAGDAYHLFSPVGGHNMNTGFQDAINLGWKIGYYLRNWASRSILDSYTEERSIAIQKLLDVTNINTQIIMRRNTTHSKINSFKPAFSNRKYYRTEFPYEFAGYFADHSIQKDSLVGKHVPYLSKLSGDTNIESTYDLPLLKKLIVFFNDETQDSPYLAKLSGFKHILDFMPINSTDRLDIINKLQLKDNNICIIRPDGMIGFHGKLEDSVVYFKQFYYDARS